MWQQHWGLARDPFDEVKTPYVPLPSHDEALFRLVYSIEQGRRDVVFAAEAGLGKTIVLRRALSEIRSPGRRVVLIDAPSDGGQALIRLAERLGHPIGRESNLPSQWQALERSFRVAALQGLQIVLALDNWSEASNFLTLHDLHAMAHGRSEVGPRLTIVRVGCPSPGGFEPFDTWGLTIRLMRLTRSQAEDYLTLKLAAAGCTERIFTPRAMTRLHGLSRGVPRGLERLAALSLMAGAVRGLEVIPPDIVDGVAKECQVDESKVKTWQ